MKIVLVRRKGDITILTKRAVVQADTETIAGGIALEPIPITPRGEAPGMVLVKTGWRRQYFLRQRADWTEENYFARAEFLMEKQGIAAP